MDTGNQGKSVCIIGAGLSGLICGMRLSKAGFSVQIIEEMTYPGGLLFSSRIGKEYLELIPHHIRKTDKTLLQLSKELGISDQIEWFDSSWHGKASRKKLGYYSDGFSTLINSLIQSVIDNGGSISYGTTVTEIVKKDDKYVTVCVITNSTQVKYTSDFVIFTGSCRSFVNSVYGLPLGINVRDQLMNITYKTELCLMMVLKKRPSEVYFHWIGEGHPFSRIVNHSNCFGERQYGGNVVYLVGECSISDPLWIESDAKIKDTFFASYRKIFPQITKTDIKAWRVTKIRYAVPRSYPDTDLTNPAENLYICASALVSTVNEGTPVNRMDQVASLADKISNAIISKVKDTTKNPSDDV